MQADRRLCINPDWPAPATGADREIPAFICSLRPHELGLRS
jgi:hypothetical protein